MKQSLFSGTGAGTYTERLFQRTEFNVQLQHIRTLDTAYLQHESLGGETRRQHSDGTTEEFIEPGGCGFLRLLGEANYSDSSFFLLDSLVLNLFNAIQPILRNRMSYSVLSLYLFEWHFVGFGDIMSVCLLLENL